MGTLVKVTAPTRCGEISGHTNDITVTGNLASETLDWTSDLIDLRKTNDTLEFDTGDHERPWN